MLTVRHRLGFTLIEVVLSTVMMLIVSGALYQLLTTTQRLSRAQREQLAVQSSVRSAALLVVNELRELQGGIGSSGSAHDIVSMASAAVTYRAMRGFGLICQPTSGNQIHLSRQGFSGHRDPQAGRDSAYVFIGSSDSAGADAWLPVAITQVSVGAVCPGAGGSISLTVPSTLELEGRSAGTPVRTYEVMELRLYQSDGRAWLGMRSVSAGEVIQPLTGPLRDGDGLRLEYLGPGGAPTSVAAEVRSIRVTVRGESEGTVNFGALESERAEEELTTQVALRNALR